MKIIKCLAERITDELDDADTYVELAMKWKDEEPETAELFYELSTEEMNSITGNNLFSRQCIYGENREQDSVLSNCTICDGCWAEIMKNVADYHHN